MRPLTGNTIRACLKKMDFQAPKKILSVRYLNTVLREESFFSWSGKNVTHHEIVVNL